MKEQENVLDVIIVGAGLSGIDAAYRIQSECPNKEYTVLEGRNSMGGTWDLFKYPGIRSDSDMYTLGFPFYPWKDPKAIADGPAILSYIKETASHFGIDKKIQYNHKVVHAAWSEEERLWTLTIAAHENVSATQLKTKFLFMTSGYYRYDQGYAPNFPKSEVFKGPIIHPQKWDTNLDYTDKEIIVIGSGATAVTLVPELGEKAKKVTMLQRSPTYILTLPSEDVIANNLRKILPSQWAYNLSKWKNVLISIMMYYLSKNHPEFIKKVLKKGVHRGLKTDELDEHFTPRYDPWDQRLCLVPDGDFFKSIRKGKATIVTDTIQEFTQTGIKLNSGKELNADIIVSATGLQLQLLGGMTVEVNGEKIDTSKVHSYKGVMFSNIPNFGFAVGYTNNSWTLKCDLNCQYVARLLNYMDDNNKTRVIPQFDSEKFDSEPLLDFDAGYVKRAEAFLPKQGSKAPWKVHQNYIKDTFALKLSKINNEHLEFT